MHHMYYLYYSISSKRKYYQIYRLVNLLPSEQALRNRKWIALTGKDANSSSYSWEMHSHEILKLLQASNNFCHLTITIQDICFNH